MLDHHGRRRRQRHLCRRRPFEDVVVEAATRRHRYGRDRWRRPIRWRSWPMSRTSRTRQSMPIRSSVPATRSTTSSAAATSTTLPSMAASVRPTLLAGGLGDDIYVVDDAVTWSTKQPDAGIDRVNRSVSYTLGANVENLTLTGAARSTARAMPLTTSSTATPATTSSSAAAATTHQRRRRHDLIDGGTGNDTLNGGDGDDRHHHRRCRQRHHRRGSGNDIIRYTRQRLRRRHDQQLRR